MSWTLFWQIFIILTWARMIGFTFGRGPKGNVGPVGPAGETGPIGERGLPGRDLRNESPF